MVHRTEGTLGEGPQIPSCAMGGSSAKMKEPGLEATCGPSTSAAQGCRGWLPVVAGGRPAEAFAQM